MIGSVALPRLAYVRTIHRPDDERNTINSMLEEFVRQEPPGFSTSLPPHRFLFGASNSSDSHILDIFISSIPGAPSYYRFRHVQKCDLELRLSRAHAATCRGRRLIQRCKSASIKVVVCGETDEACDEIMLQECDYIIDTWTTAYPSGWFWSTARAGNPQDTLLNNTKYDMSQHDASKRRLGNRFSGYGWRAMSGCSHGNGIWRCRGCGGKCKRGKCKFASVEEGHVWIHSRLPEKGTREWLDLTAEDIMRKYICQKGSGKHVVEAGLLSSIDTFSGE